MIQYVFNIGTFFSLLYYVNNITILQCQINGKEYSFSFPLRTTQITWCKQFLTDELKSCCTIVKVIRLTILILQLVFFPVLLSTALYCFFCAWKMFAMLQNSKSTPNWITTSHCSWTARIASFVVKAFLPWLI